MKIFVEMVQSWRKELVALKQQELLKKIKKPYTFNYVDIDVDKEVKEGRMVMIDDFRLADDGTPRMYQRGLKYPVRSYNDSETVKLVSYYKKTFPLILKSISKQNVFQKIISIWGIALNKEILEDYFQVLWNNNPALLKDEHYSQVTKEVRRVLKPYLKQSIVDGIALVIEYDTAYRYRFQDIMEELDKGKIGGFKTIREVNRLIDLLSSRDYPEMRYKWQGVKKILNLLWYLSPKFRKITNSILSDLKIEEIKMSVEDIFHSNWQVTDYCRKGLNREQREKENLTL